MQFFTFIIINALLMFKCKILVVVCYAYVAPAHMKLTAEAVVLE